MSTSIHGINFDNQTVTAKDHGRLFQCAIEDGIISGCELSFSGSSLMITPGYFVAAGREMKLTATTSVIIDGATSGYARVLISIDLAQTATTDTFEQAAFVIEYATTATGFPSLTQEDVNGTGRLYEFPLCVVALGAAGISSIYSSADAACVRIPLIVADMIASGAVTAAKIGTSAVSSAKIASAAVTEVKIASGAVTAAKIGTDGVTADKIQASAVTNAKIADSAVTNAKIADAAVTTAKVADANITTAKLADGAATVAKGGTGRTTLTANYVLVGNGTSAVSMVTPSTSGYILMSNGTSSLPSFKAQTNITAVGTLTSGTWNATAIAMTKGGTGATSGATGLKNLLAAGNTILSSYQYGSSLPSAGTKGRLFFKTVG